MRAPVATQRDKGADATLGPELAEFRRHSVQLTPHPRHPSNLPAAAEPSDPGTYRRSVPGLRSLADHDRREMHASVVGGALR